MLLTSLHIITFGYGLCSIFGLITAVLKGALLLGHPVIYGRDGAKVDIRLIVWEIFCVKCCVAF